MSISLVSKQVYRGFLAAGGAAWQHLKPAWTHLLLEVLVSLWRVLTSVYQGINFLENKLFPLRA